MRGRVCAGSWPRCVFLARLKGTHPAGGLSPLPRSPQDSLASRPGPAPKGGACPPHALSGAVGHEAHGSLPSPPPPVCTQLPCDWAVRGQVWRPPGGTADPRGRQQVSSGAWACAQLQRQFALGQLWKCCSLGQDGWGPAAWRGPHWGRATGRQVAGFTSLASSVCAGLQSPKPWWPHCGRGGRGAALWEGAAGLGAVGTKSGWACLAPPALT